MNLIAFSSSVSSESMLSGSYAANEMGVLLIGILEVPPSRIWQILEGVC